jgi:signal peptidase II
MRIVWLSLFIVLADQITKVVVKTNMYLGQSIPVVGDLFRFTFTENPGMAFGLSIGSKLFLTLFSVLATFLILGYLWQVRRAPTGYRLALALVLGGAAGNVIDRVFYGAVWDYAPLFYGKVVDFLHVDLWSGFIPASVPLLGGRYMAFFPIGNIADVSILIGIGMVLWTQKAFHAHLHAEHEAARPVAAEAVTPPVDTPPMADVLEPVPGAESDRPSEES